MSKHNRDKRDERDPNPEPSVMVKGHAYWRGRDGWILANMTLPQHVAEKYATFTYEPDLLGMVEARVSECVAKAAQ